MKKAIFFDPERKRWRRVRRVMLPLGVVITFTVAFFFSTLFHDQRMESFSLPEIKRPLHRLSEKEPHVKLRKAGTTHRKTSLPPSQIPMNADEGLRAAYYVPWDEGS